MISPPDFFPKGLSKMGREFFVRTPRLLSLDFDGTLSEIAPTPQSAWMTEDLRTTLWALSLLPKTRLVILSGRSIQDLKRKVNVPGIFYIGNHGMDFSPPSAGWGIRALKQWTAETKAAQERLEPLVDHWPGSLLEVKGPDLSLHYRRLKPGQVRKLLPEAFKAVEGLPLAARQGKCVLEFRPLDSPGKGDALTRLADRFFDSQHTGACLHVGDDLTDEDAFQALRRMGRRNLGLKVGEGPSRAHFRLKGLDEVHRFLKLFLENY